MSFIGFQPDASHFFTRLSENNTKEWFTDHKGEYEELVKGPMIQLIAQLVSDFHAAGIPLHADPTKSIMRPNRDVRFSKDKSPYKTNISATMTRTGERHAQGLIYIHLDPTGSFIGSGFYEMEPAELAAMRNRIVQDADEWRALQTGLSKKSMALDGEGSLTRLPKGFDADLPDDLAAGVRMKSFVTKLELAANDLRSPDLPKRIVGFAENSLPLLRFGWSALGVDHQ